VFVVANEKNVNTSAGFPNKKSTGRVLDATKKWTKPQANKLVKPKWKVL